MKSSKTKTKTDLSPNHRDELLATLQTRFEENMRRHAGMSWATVKARLDAHDGKLRTLTEMERTGGEPDVVGRDRGTGAVLFFDCSPQTPKGRVSLCYDREALDSRKEAKPAGSAMEMAAGMGIELLTEAQYHELQALGEFDTKTSSWLMTPAAVRELGGALFGDRRFNRVFVYHNGAQSYFGARGFRGSLRI